MKIFRYIWAIYFLIWFVILFILFYPIFFFLLKNPKWYRTAHQLRRFWGRIVLFVIGVIPKTTKDETLDRSKEYIFVANHFSYLDIVTMGVQVPFYFSFLAKKELASIPLFKTFFTTLDIPVDRKRSRKSYESFQKASQKLEEGASLVIFPEGGIGRRAPKMRSFKAGAFRLAIEHGIDIVPITMADNWKRLYSGGFENGGTPGLTRMHIHRSIPTSHLNIEDVDALKNEVYAIIENQWKAMNPNYDLDK